MALMALNVFTLSNVSAQVPSTYQLIEFDSFTESTLQSNAYLGGRDTVYNDLWTFVNFNQAYIEINGIIVVDNGSPIEDVSYNYQLSGGEYFRVEYDNVFYFFTLNTTVFTGGLGGDDQPVLPNAMYVSGLPADVNYETLIVNLYLPVEGGIAEPDAEGGFLELLVGYGIYNVAGLLTLFAVTLIIVNIALAFLQVPSIVYIIGNMVIGVGFMSVNFIPLWAGFIFISVLALFLILSIKGVRV